MVLNIIIQKDNESGWYWGRIVEYPAVVSQGASIEELKENLKDALKLYLETQKELINKQYKGSSYLKRKLEINI